MHLTIGGTLWVSNSSLTFRLAAMRTNILQERRNAAGERDQAASIWAFLGGMGRGVDRNREAKSPLCIALLGITVLRGTT